MEQPIQVHKLMHQQDKDEWVFRGYVSTRDTHRDVARTWGAGEYVFVNGYEQDANVGDLAVVRLDSEGNTKGISDE